jgi:hypothetical protein
MTREDVWSNTEADAAIAEQMRGMAEDDDSRPTDAEIRRDMAGLPAGRAGHECQQDKDKCLVCRLELVLDGYRNRARHE